MFNFKNKQDPMVTTVRDTIGTREQYINFTKKEYTLTKEEKDTLLQASIHANKKIPNMDIIHDAYGIMIGVGAIEGEVKESIKDGEKSTSDTRMNIRRWLTPGFIVYLILVGISISIEEVAMPGMDEAILILLMTLLVWLLKLFWNFIAKLEEKSPTDRPKEVKHASFVLRVAFIFSIVVDLFAIFSMTAHNNHSSATSSILTNIGLIIGVGIVLNWYVIKSIINGVKWVKTTYLILVFISLFTFFPSLESMSWMKNIYKFNFITQEIFAIITSILLLQPSSTKWFNTMSLSKGNTINPLHDIVNKAQETVPKNNEPFSYIDEIKKLGELKEDGLLTEEEFLSQKQKLLNN